jgi:hypothetical protein
MTTLDREPGAAPVAARLRPISGFEEELLSAQAGARNTAALCNEVLARCLVGPGLDPGPARAEVRSLLVPERDLALLALRRRSFGDRVESDVSCPACGRGNEISFSLADMPTPAPTTVREIAVERDGAVARVRLPTAADQERILDAADDPAARRTALLAQVLVDLDGRPGPFAADDVRALPSAVRLAIEHAIEAALPDVDLSMDVGCNWCGHDFTVPFDLCTFFFAEMTGNARRLRRDVHVLARTYHWEEATILALPRTRRCDYLAMIEADELGALVGGAT